MKSRQTIFYVFFLLFGVLFFSCSSKKSLQKHQDILQKASKAYESGSYYEAIALYKKIAQDSDQAALKLSEIYSSDDLGKQDLQKAFYWAKKVADKKSGKGLYYMGLYYLSSNVSFHNPFLALQSFKKSYALGYVASAYQIAVLYSKGIGVERDWGKARRWARKAANSEVKPAMYLYGHLLYEGKGGKQEKKQGLQWIYNSRLN